MLLCFAIEVISRHSIAKAFGFFALHTWAFAYNAFIIFASLSLVYLLRRRALGRIVISGMWLFLGTINGCVLSNRVTPFGYTDLKCISDLLAMQNTNYFTAGEAALVVFVVSAFLIFCVFLFFKGPKFQGERRKVLTPCLIGFLFLMVPVTTHAAQNSNILASYFANIAQGYENYGFVYGFSTSVVDRGMRKPDRYSEESVEAAKQVSKKEASTEKKQTEYHYGPAGIVYRSDRSEFPSVFQRSDSKFQKTDRNVQQRASEGASRWRRNCQYGV